MMLEQRRHGGARPGSGAKRTWRTPGPMSTMKLPAVLLPRARDLVRQLDAGGPVLYDDDTNAAAVREAIGLLRARLAWLGEDRKRKPNHSDLRRVLAALEHYQMPVEPVNGFKRGDA